MSTYELLSICCGIENIILKTKAPSQIKALYGYGLRIRIDGRLLTIREADKFCGQRWTICRGIPRPKPIKVSPWGIPYGRGVHVAPNRRAVELVIGGQVAKHYVSITEAALDNRLSLSTVQSRCCGRLKETDGRMFRYAES